MNKDWLTQSVITVNRWYAHYCVAGWLEPQWQLSRQRLDDCVNAGEPYKHDQTTTVAKVKIGRSELVLKRYNPRSFGHKIKRALRRSRAQRCWQMSYLFTEAGINVAAPVFMFEERFLFIRKQAYFANQYLLGDELLQALPNMTLEQQSKVAEAFRQAMTKMQLGKLSHGDMKASNLLWVDDKLFFIDLDAARQHKSNASWRRANRRDRKRFLKNWRNMPELQTLFGWLE